MANSLFSRCIRRWKLRFKPICDSKVSPVWHKRDLNGYIRDCAITTGDCLIERLASDNAKVDFDGAIYGWSPEFSDFFSQHRDKYIKEAHDFLNEEITTEEIDDAIDDEIECWND
ncbi:Uncharacterised protein [Yersinia intermedia]|uniref:hypothetical protein n=1 Tax=Yersinia intermedia TaxID=631 RepID=UPI0005E7F4D9|nr:hypothetical protein [Yersinia intermedia]CNK44123.1 Uncharacterised protein [Yersinia intermedia]